MMMFLEAGISRWGVHKRNNLYQLFFFSGRSGGLGAAELYRHDVAFKSQEWGMDLSMQHHSPAALRAFPLLVTEVAKPKGGIIDLWSFSFDRDLILTSGHQLSSNRPLNPWHVALGCCQWTEERAALASGMFQWSVHCLLGSGACWCYFWVNGMFGRPLFAYKDIFSSCKNSL